MTEAEEEAGQDVGARSGVDASDAGVRPRSVEAPDGSWEVRVAGVTRSGSGQDAGAPLLLLSFARVGEPEASVREALTVGSSLEAIPDDDLAELFARSRSAQSISVPLPPAPSG
ncbi:MAG: hypothetical protein EXR92_05500 [Gemmatimonadetes bacterium]|nr:hypothetical protein [Gemmatimonadota bacterium]